MQQANPRLLAATPPLLSVPLDPQSPIPLYLQLRDALRGLMASGTLAAGQRLAPTRDLARQLGVNRTTVSAAYAELEAEGWLAGHVGRGTFVTGPISSKAKPRAIARATARAVREPFSWSRFFPDARNEDSEDALMRTAAGPGAISLAAAHPPLRALPWAEFRRAADTVMRKVGRDLLRPGPPEGSPALKAWLAQFLTAQGVPARPEEILITNGCQQGLDLIAKALLDPGQAVALENPVYPGAWAPMRQAGATLLPVPVGENGMDLPALEALLERQRVRLIIVSPNFQNPTGTTMTLEARRRLLELVREWQIPVVENDSYGLLRCTGPALPSLRSLDGAGQTLYAGSFSKIGFPGLRLGWCLAAPEVIARLRRAKQATDLHTDGFVQAVMEEFARRGGVERAVAAVRRACTENLDLLAEGVDAHFPSQVRWRRPQGGMAAWFTLPAGLDAANVLKRCLERHVVFTPGRFFYFHAPQVNTFRLSFAALERASLTRGIEILGDALRAECRLARRHETPAPVSGGWALV